MGMGMGVGMGIEIPSPRQPWGTVLSMDVLNVQKIIINVNKRVYCEK